MGPMVGWLGGEGWLRRDPGADRADAGQLFQVLLDNLLSRAITADLAAVKPDAAVTESGDRVQAVRDEQQRPPLRDEALNPLQAFLLEGQIADRQNLVEQQDV